MNFSTSSNTSYIANEIPLAYIRLVSSLASYPGLDHCEDENDIQCKILTRILLICVISVRSPSTNETTNYMHSVADSVGQILLIPQFTWSLAR